MKKIFALFVLLNLCLILSPVCAKESVYFSSSAPRKNTSYLNNQMNSRSILHGRSSYNSYNSENRSHHSNINHRYNNSRSIVYKNNHERSVLHNNPQSASLRTNKLHYENGRYVRDYNYNTFR